MNVKDFYDLSIGDIVRNNDSLSLDSYVVMANYGGRVTAVRTVDMTNPHEWDLIFRANFVSPVHSQ